MSYLVICNEWLAGCCLCCCIVQMLAATGSAAAVGAQTTWLGHPVLAVVGARGDCILAENPWVVAWGWLRRG